MHPLLRFTLDLFGSDQPVVAPDVHISHPQARREVQLGSVRIAYEFQRAARRSIGFSIGAQGLSVRAPHWMPLREVEAALQAKAAWIVRKLQESRIRQAQQAAQSIEWRDGACIPYLGQPLILRLDPEHRFAARGGAALQGDAKTPRQLCVSLAHNASAEQIRDAVQAWLMRQARQIFLERLDHFAPLLGVTYRKLSLSQAVTRWGSATASGSIRLNWRLVHFTMAVLDYVVVHELSHLRVMNHGPQFWATVQRVMPDYAQLRRQLKDSVVPR